MKVRLVTVMVATIFLSLALANHSAVALNADVKCRPPEPGMYTLGWGTSRLVIPKEGRPYYTFRMQRTMVVDTLCRSGDNSGVVAFRADGTVWAYVKVPN